MSKHNLGYIFKLLSWFCPEHLYEEIEGDLIQRFHKDEKILGRKTAKRKLLWNTLKFIRPGILLRNRIKLPFNQADMFHHYFKTTVRHIRHSKLNFAFKLGGLTVAILSLFIIVLYVSYQWSFDKFHEGHENIYRVNSNRDEDRKIVAYSMVPPAIGPALKDAFPEIEAFARFGVSSRVMIKYHDKLLRLSGFIEADSSIFNVLTFKFIKGSKEALHQQGSIVLTETTAKQIFGTEDPIGKIISSPDHANRLVQVTAVVEDYPSNSHLAINAIHSVGAFQNTEINSWEITWDGSVNLFVRLAHGTDVAQISKKAEPILRKNLIPQENGGEKRFSIFLQPISKIYLDDVLKMEFNKKGNPLYPYIFLMLGIFLLIIACINYINLSIADFDTRTREIGVRKAMGARKRQLGFQVMLEAVMICALTLVVGVILLYLLFPSIVAFLEPNLRFDMLANREVLILIGSIVLLIILFSSIYPAYRLALQNPSTELRSNSGYSHNMQTGKILLVAQCSISVICICGTLVVARQMTFVKEADVGYDRSHVVSLVMPDEYPLEKAPLLKNELGRLAGVEATSFSYYLLPVSTYFKDWYLIEKEGKMEKMLLNEMFVDHDYFDVMGIELTEGRNFQGGNSSDVQKSFIINEAAAKAWRWKDPIGKRIATVLPNGATLDGSVVGVVKDFNTLSLHQKIEPVVIRLQHDTWPGNALNVKVSGSLSQILPLIITTYEKLMPGFLADARSVEDLFQRQYQDENKAFRSLQVATVVIILISALGIFSLSLYMSVKRMKEFGIRKVLGATVLQIAKLHLAFFLKIVLVANMIGLPIAYWVMKEWLDHFAYRVELSGFIFLSVMFISFFLVFISGGYSALRAAFANPAEVIKVQ